MVSSSADKLLTKLVRMQQSTTREKKEGVSIVLSPLLLSSKIDLQLHPKSFLFAYS